MPSKICFVRSLQMRSLGSCCILVGPMLLLAPAFAQPSPALPSVANSSNSSSRLSTQSTSVQCGYDFGTSPVKVTGETRFAGFCAIYNYRNDLIFGPVELRGANPGDFK